MPKLRFAASRVSNTGEVRKLALFASREGTACTSRKSPIAATAATTRRPEPEVSPRKMRSPRPGVAFPRSVPPLPGSVSVTVSRVADPAAEPSS